MAFKQHHHPSELALQARWNSKPSHIPHPGLSFEGDPGKTDPSGAADCDINNIVERYARAGGKIDLGRYHPEVVFGDTTLLPSDYSSALQMVIDAQNAFMTLPAEVRKRFDNDPARFVDFVDDPSNGPDLVAMGFATSRAPTPQPASSAPATAAGGAPEAKAEVKTPL